MKQDPEKQYDDDLTIGTNEYDDSYYTDADDLFDFSTSDESPISRLKSLVLSIDWEITDEVLLQFNEELIDLKGIWADNSINLVYVQALEKLSKYIYQNKANSHPNAIKLLLTLYYNLEKIVVSVDLTEAQKKEILLEDVKRFEALKRQISQKAAAPQEQKATTPAPQPVESKKKTAPEDTLLNLKAIVLGIDWEITDQDLNDLRREVVHLEGVFANSKPKLILLQGIGTLGAYIKTKKSNAHADAFKVLHLFYESLERTVKNSMSLEEEKAVLFPAVQRFNDFKSLLGPTISPEAISRAEEEDEDEEFSESGGEIRPALADVAEEEAVGFQAEEEAKALGIANPEGVSSHIDDFFGEDVQAVREGGGSEAQAGELLAHEEDAAALPMVDREMALQGVDVGLDEEEEEDVEHEPVAALSDVDGDDISEWHEESDEAKKISGEGEHPPLTVSDEEVARAADSFFSDDESFPAKAIGGVDREAALQGVNVESEADEDSDEASLPMEGEDVAPALLTSEEESLFSAATLANATGGIDDEIAGTLDGLFLEDEEIAELAADVAAADEESEEEVPEAPEQQEAESFAGWEQTSLQEPLEDAGVDRQPELERDREEGTEAAGQEEGDLGLFFQESELEESAEVDSLFESLEPVLIEENEADEIPAEEASPVEVAEEISLPAEEATSEEQIEEITLVGDGLSEEGLSFAEPEAPIAGPDLSGPEEMEIAEEEIPPAEAQLAEEEMLAMEEEPFPAEEETPLTEEVSPAAEEPGVEAEISFTDEISASVDAESFFAGEETFSLGQPEVEPAPVEEPIAEEVEKFPAEETASTYPPSSAEETPSVDDHKTEADEEEVVFELAEEPAEVEPAPEPPESIAPGLEESEPVVADEVAEDLSFKLSEDVATEDTEDFAVAVAGETGTITGDNPLAGLQGCIASLGLELDDTIINGMFREINALQQKWSTRPLEKTFLQLISTVTQHIDRYRFEASADAHNLLLSIFNTLAATQEADSHANQELLLMETLKVLEWQQEMLIRQAVEKGSQLTFATPVRTEEGEVESVVDARQEFDQLLQQYENPEAIETLADDPLSTISEQPADFGKEFTAAELKQEIASLRMTLQKEIAELRSELKVR